MHGITSDPEPDRGARYDFRRLRHDDLPMLRRWLATPLRP